MHRPQQVRARVRVVGKAVARREIAHDGRVVFAPSCARGVGVFTPSSCEERYYCTACADVGGVACSWEYFDIAATLSNTNFNFDGAATASSGHVVFAPRRADGVGVFDPASNAFTLVDISSALGGSTDQVRRAVS